MTIEGNGSTLQWNGPQHARAFSIAAGGDLTIRNMYIKGFTAKGGDGGSGGGGGLGAGGAIYVEGGRLTVENSTFDFNRAIGGIGSVRALLLGGGGGGGGLGGNGGTTIHGTNGGNSGGGSRGNGVSGGGGPGAGSGGGGTLRDGIMGGSIDLSTGGAGGIACGGRAETRTAGMHQVQPAPAAAGAVVAEDRTPARGEMGAMAVGAVAVAIERSSRMRMQGWVASEAEAVPAITAEPGPMVVEAGRAPDFRLKLRSRSRWSTWRFGGTGGNPYGGGGGAGLGGAIFSHNGRVVIQNSTFTTNFAFGGSNAVDSCDAVKCVLPPPALAKARPSLR